jgi:3-(3-hydroxy-phenyl)propionate hydroxylase
VLDLSERYPFARPLVNSGRLSVPCTYDGSALNGEDALLEGPPRSRPGSPCPDVPLDDGFLLDRLDGRFHLLTVDAEAPERLEEAGVAVTRLALSAADDPSGALAARYLGEARSAVYLIRPDQHVVARWAAYDDGAVRRALRRALGRE